MTDALEQRLNELELRYTEQQELLLGSGVRATRDEHSEHSEDSEQRECSHGCFGWASTYATRRS